MSGNRIFVAVDCRFRGSQSKSGVTVCQRSVLCVALAGERRSANCPAGKSRKLCSLLAGVIGATVMHEGEKRFLLASKR